MLARVTDETHNLTADALRAQILGLVREYHQVAFPDLEFVPGSARVACTSIVCFCRSSVTSLMLRKYEANHSLTMSPF